MMQVFLPCSLLMLVGIPRWPHQLISWYISVFIPQTFFIHFNFYSHICSFPSQYPQVSPDNSGVLGHLWSQNDVIMSWLSLTATSTIHIRHIWNVWEHWYIVLEHTAAALSRYPHYLGQILGFWVTCGVKIRSLRHGWGWQPTQTASCVHIIHIQSVWAHLYAVRGHIAVASKSYTHTSWLIFLGSGSLVESKWCYYVMVEADIHPKLLATSTLDIYKVFEHIDVLSIGKWQ